MFQVYQQALKNGETMAYREEKTNCNGPTLLLIHGNQSSSLFYEHLMEDLKEKAHIYAIDLIGFGDSSYHHAHKTMKDWADDLALFMEEKEIDQAIVLGWSAGGGCALELAACYPDKVKHLILLASVGVQGFKLPLRDENGAIVEGKYLSKREDIIKDPGTMIPITHAIEKKDSAFLEKVWKATIFNLHCPKKEDLDAYMQAILKERCFVDISVALCQFNITSEDDLVKGSGRIHDIQCPVTWIHGKKDIIVNYEVGANSVKFFDAKAQLLPIEDAGHASFMDQPERFKEIMEEILR